MPVAYGGQSQQRWGDNTLNSSEYIRDFYLTDISAQPRSTAAVRKAGKMLVVAFFRTTDAVCQRTLPTLQKLADAYADAGKLEVWAISQDDREATAAFAEQRSIKFPLLLDRDQWYSMTFGVSTVPTTYLVDSKGLVQKKLVGFDSAGLNEISVRIAAFLEREAVPV